MSAVLLAWLAEMGIVTWRDLTGKVKNHTIEGFPLPADYVATFVIFGALGMVPKDNPGASRAAALLAWAYVVATYMNVAPALVNPTGTPKATGTAAATSSQSTASSTTVGG